MSSVDEDRSIYNGHFEVDTLIDRPARDVWKHFLNMPLWVTSHSIENVHGTPGTVGSITRVWSTRAKEMGVPEAHYHYCKLIKVVPEKQWILKTFSEKGGSYGMEMTGFDDGRLIGLGNQTRVVFDIFIEMKGEAIAKDPGAMNLDAGIERMLKNLANLKRLVEGK